MNQAEMPADDPARRRRKRLLFTMKVGLALTILLVILYNVKVRDHVTIPEGSPFAGRHPGWIQQTATDLKETITFRRDSEFLFEAELVNGKIASATIADGEGRIHEFTPQEVPRLEYRFGLVSVLKKTDLKLWFLSILIYFAAISITTIRWALLLKATDLPQSLVRAFRLVFIGVFFNNVVPGQTGGDLVRAYYVARENRKRKTDSIITVIVDRALGITALAIIAALVIPTDFELYGEGAAVIYGGISLVVVGSLIFFSKRLRRLFKLDVLLKKLPFKELFQKVDRSIFLYRYRKASIFICFLMSFVVHVTIITSVWILGKGLKVDLPLLSYLAYIPIIFIISSIPLTPAGWGVGEASFIFFFGAAGTSPVQALALSLVFRVNAALVSLLGGAFLFLEKRRLVPHDMDFDEEGEDEDPSV